jgi:transposase
MQAPSSVFSQITTALYPAEFARCAELFPNQRPTRGLTAYDQFLALCFGQLTYRESLRDIVACLQAKGRLLYHLGFRGNLSRTNLAYANYHRNWRLFQAVAQILMRRAARLYREDSSDPDLPKVAFALDSSIISLSLNLFPWGYYARSRQAAVKLHLMLSLQGNLPAWAAITEADFPDMKMLDDILVAPGAYYVMDRGYLDFIRLFKLHQTGGFFVVRNKHHVKFRVAASRSVDKCSGLRCDQTITLASNWSVKSYPQPLRRIRVYDSENKVTLVLLTNQFDLPAAVIAQLYRKRWQVELFFKWIKQHLRIRSFYGRSENAVRCQIWSAICAYLMVAVVKKQLQIGKSLNEILQIVSVNIFEQTPLKELLVTEPIVTDRKIADDHFQKPLLLKDQ